MSLTASLTKLRGSMEDWTRELRADRLTSEAMQRMARENKERLSLRNFEMKFATSAPDGTFSGYGALFGDDSTHPTSAWGLSGDWNDVLERGCFAETLAEHEARGTLPACLMFHDPDRPVGAFDIMREDSRGLYIEGRLVTSTSDGMEAAELARAGALTGLSIGFMVTREQLDQKTKTRRITGVDLYEVSLVSIPAIAAARISDIKQRSSYR